MDPLDPQESGVALVGVENLRRGGAGEAGNAQGLDPAHAQQQFLLKTVVAAAAVQPSVMPRAASSFPARWSPAAAAARGRHRPATCVQQPAAVGAAAVNLDGRAVRPRSLTQQGQRQRVGVKHRVRFLLPGVPGQRLLEVAGLVQKADADQRHAEVGGRLQVVAGQDAQAARVLGEYFGDAKFGGEVGDAGRRSAPRLWYQRGCSRYLSTSFGGGGTRRTTSGSAASPCSSSRDQAQESDGVVGALGPDPG